MAVAAIGGSSSVPVVDPAKTGFNGLTADHFMKMLITQLKNQDPLEPVGNEEILNQISTMRSLQSNIELGDAMKAITSNQQLSTAAGFIGRSVTGTDATNRLVTGIASRALLRDGKAYVAVGDIEMPLANVTGVEEA
ncbi:MAG: flagellar hook capping FlgD N-terminal domain-containing protein [Planctomycetaceae bacterium]